MSIQTQIDRIAQNVSNTYSVLSDMGATMPEEQNTNNLPNTAANITAVLYGKKQNLTDEQKAQVKENIGLEYDSPAIIDVVELPTEDIREDVFYRLLTSTFVYNQYTQTKRICHCTDSLPEVGEPAVSGDLSSIENAYVTVYYNINDGSVSGYVTETLSAVFGVPAGWYPCAVLMSAVGQTFAGVITDIMDDPRDNAFRVLLEYVTWSHKNGEWTSYKVIGWTGDGNGAEVFNHPANKAYGNVSHAEGRFTIAGKSGVETYGEHAEGHGSHAEGESSHSEGYYSHAEGDASHSEGHYSHAEGHFSHAEGESSRAEGDASHAEGAASHAESYCSHAEGVYSHAAGRSQHAQGEFNITDPDYNPNDLYIRGKYAHIVGNGSDDDNRSNAHTLDWDGNAWFQGTIKLGGTGQDDAPEEVATKSYVDTAIQTYIDESILGGAW